MILSAVEQARAAGARLSECAKTVEIDARTLQRWARNPESEDGRKGPRTAPHNRLSQCEREHVLETVNSPEYRDLSPKQIVPKLADSGVYLASESTIYRILDAENQLAHRGRERPRQSVRPEEFIATGSNQVWSWDITYLRSPVSGLFFYLYMVVDVWSRKIVGWQVHERECSDLASKLVVTAIETEVADPNLLVLHQDNGSPMKGATLKATLEALGVMASYSRPRVSDDNPFSEALFRTLKYRPEYPRKPFESLDKARRWVEEFVDWYNNQHLHSAIGFVTPSARHHHTDHDQLARRRIVYDTARQRHPQRWTKNTRSWTSPHTVTLNPSKQTNQSQSKSHAA